MVKESLVKRKYINYVNNIIKNNKVSHAYLFEIEDYNNDYNYIIDFIKMIITNCSYEEIKNSSNPIFDLIDKNEYLDIKVIEPEKNIIKKNQIVDLQMEYNNKSLLNGKRIYIIKQVEKMNLSSANTILKFLEEPENDIIAILVTENRYQVIETILSRCQIISLKDAHVSFNIDENVLTLLSCVINPQNFFIEYKKIIGVYEEKDSIFDALRIVENIIVSFINNKYEIEDLSLGDSVISLFSDIDNKTLLNRLSILEDSLFKLDFNINYKLWLDSLFASLIIGG